MSARTPGPWKLDGGRRDTLCVVSPSGERIAVTYETDRQDEEWHNARLIAAAPELLAALENIAQVAYPGSASAAIARAAIAKAEGREP